MQDDVVAPNFSGGQHPRAKESDAAMHNVQIPRWRHLCWGVDTWCQREGYLHGERRFGIAQKGNAVDPSTTRGKGNLALQHGRHHRKELLVGPRRLQVLRLVEVLAQPLPPFRAEPVPPHEAIQVVHVLVKLRLRRVGHRDDSTEGANDLPP